MNSALINILKVAVITLPDSDDRREALAILLDSQENKITGDMASVRLYNPADPGNWVEIPMVVLNEIKAASSKIYAIKVLRLRSGIGLKEAKLTIEHPGNALGFTGNKCVVDPQLGRRYYLTDKDFESIKASDWPTTETQHILGVNEHVARRIVRHGDNGLQRVASY